MSNFVEQRSAIKIWLGNDISAAETCRMLQKAFGNDTMSQKNVYKWYRDFKEGRERVEDLQRSDINNDDINKIMEMELETILELVEGSFGPQKSKIAFGAEISQFLRKRASRSSM